MIGIHVTGLLDAWGDDSGAGKHLAESRVRLLEEIEGPWRQPFVEHGVRHRVELRDGNPVHVLLSAVDDLRADLIMVGSKGVGGLAEQLVGSTSTQIAEHSAVPVVVVPGEHPRRATASITR